MVGFSYVQFQLGLLFQFHRPLYEIVLASINVRKWSSADRRLLPAYHSAGPWQRKGSFLLMSANNRTVSNRPRPGARSWRNRPFVAVQSTIFCSQLRTSRLSTSWAQMSV